MDMGKKPLGNEVRAPKTEETTTPATQETPVQPMAVKEKKHYQSKRFVLWRTVVILLLIFATALVVAGWFYTQDLYSQLNKKEAEIAELQSSRSDKLTDGSQLAKNDDESITPQSQVSAQALDSVEAFMSTNGVTRVPYEATVSYIDDNFARVRVDYLAADNSEPTGKGEVFYFKRVQRVGEDETWAMIGINPISNDEVMSMRNRYGMPAKVLTENKPE